MGKLKTEIKGLNELIGYGIEPGSPVILYGPPETRKPSSSHSFPGISKIEGCYYLLEWLFFRIIGREINGRKHSFSGTD
jgi:hypothetical protein